MSIAFFTNGRYKILLCMYQRQIDISGKLYVPLSQREISTITGIAYKTVNSIINELRSNGYLDYQGTTRGKYSLTQKAQAELLTMQNKEAAI